MFVAINVLSKFNCLFKKAITLEVTLKNLFTVFLKLTCTEFNTDNTLLIIFNKFIVLVLRILNILFICFNIELVVVDSTVKVLVYKVELKDENGASANELNPNIRHPQHQRSL
jgi:hypothetical protein